MPDPLPPPSRATLAALLARVAEGEPLLADRPVAPESGEPASVAPEATGQPRPLSPAAQAVLDACDQAFGQCGTTAQGLAAALRAVADQVVPEEPLYGGDQRWIFERDARQTCRKKLLAIAAELERAND